MQEFGIIRLPRVRNVRPDGSKGRFCGRTAFGSSGFRETGNGRPKRGRKKGKGGDPTTARNTREERILRSPGKNEAREKAPKIKGRLPICRKRPQKASVYWISFSLSPRISPI
ncbi:MAG: hypothetical protein C6W56_02820 [Caldibacillus debilis]|nr:MAG: hypothetical protein C6W56_02820 [Caldibacillus debilis]